MDILVKALEKEEQANQKKREKGEAMLGAEEDMDMQEDMLNDDIAESEESKMVVSKSKSNKNKNGQMKASSVTDSEES